MFFVPQSIFNTVFLEKPMKPSNVLITGAVVLVGSILGSHWGDRYPVRPVDILTLVVDGRGEVIPSESKSQLFKRKIEIRLG